MAKSEMSKRIKHSEGIDRISALPESLHSHILSLLPTKYAVATSVLSTRWKFLWTSITNLNFDDEDALIRCPKKSLNMKKKKFTQFVNRVLLLLNPPCIQSFHLKCDQDLCDPFYLHSWICAAIGRTVDKLDLHLKLAQPMELPLSLFNYKRLAVLKLKYDIHFNAAAPAFICFLFLSTLHLSKITLTIASNCSVSFPSLKILHLDRVKYANEESVHKLFASCPVLDSLAINRSCYSDNVLRLIISIPSLRILDAYFRGRGLGFENPEDRACKLQIDTPALKFLYLTDYSMYEHFTAENLSSLDEASVIFDFDRSLTIDANSYSINVFKFIGRLFNVKFLSLSGGTLKAISSVSANIAPVFHNLTQLDLGIKSCCDWSVVIKILLPSMDNLEHLVMKGSYCGPHESWWREPLCVPMCLLRRVTEISFSKVFGDCSDELKLVSYFLKNAKALKLLSVSSYGGSEAKLKLMQKISMIPRVSQVCQVDFK